MGVQGIGCLAVILISILSVVFAQNYCNTPSGGSGQCILINNCQPLLRILQNRERPPEETHLLTSSQCGSEGRTPKVCCPSPSRTSNGGCAAERCIPIRQCPPLAVLLKATRTPEVAQTLRNAICSGQEPSSVCCTEVPDTFPIDTGLADRLLPGKGQCGMEDFEEKIFSGNVTGLDQYPWLGLVEYRTKRGTLTAVCGATLISTRYILTAGHCVLGEVLEQVGTPVSIRLGEFDKRQSVDCLTSYRGRQECNDGPTTIPIEKITPHPEYKPIGDGDKHDIALIRLASDAPYSRFIRPICLPSYDITLKQSNEPIDLLVAGWGTTEAGSYSDVKLHLLVPLVNLTQCQIAYSTRSLRELLWDKQLCAGGEEGKDACRGDSGGPLMAQESDNHYELHGLVSFGPKTCALTNVPGVYSKVFAYIPWIRSVLRE